MDRKTWGKNFKSWSVTQWLRSKRRSVYLTGTASIHTLARWALQDVESFIQHVARSPDVEAILKLKTHSPGLDYTCWQCQPRLAREVCSFNECLQPFYVFAGAEWQECYASLEWAAWWRRDSVCFWVCLQSEQKQLVVMLCTCSDNQILESRWQCNAADLYDMMTVVNCICICPNTQGPCLMFKDAYV